LNVNFYIENSRSVNEHPKSQILSSENPSSCRKDQSNMINKSMHSIVSDEVVKPIIHRQIYVSIDIYLYIDKHL
jgi:hypothetical protein